MADSLFSADTLEGLRAAATEAQRLAEAGDSSLKHVCDMVSLAVAACDAGDTQRARTLLETATAATRDLRLLFLAYQFAFRTGDYDTSERHIRRRLELAPADSIDQARAWNNYGLLHHMRGDQQAAEECLQRALEIDRRIGCLEGIARDLGNLALIPESQGDLDTAERMTREALAYAEHANAPHIAASKLCNLGEMAMARGRLAEARELLIRAEASFRSLGIEKHRLLCEQHLRDISARESGGKAQDPSTIRPGPNSAGR